MILDTNALSALVARDANLIHLLEESPRVAVTLISLGEYEFGMLGSLRKKELGKWLDAFLERAEVLSADRQTLPHYAAIRQELKHAGTPIPANDVWIAALVRQHRMPLVSRDVHFDQVKQLKRLSW